MESFIGFLGGLVILVLLVIAAGVVYILLSRWKRSNVIKQPGFDGSRKCPICGARMGVSREAPDMIHCDTPKCPNYETDI
jgi:predicted transporter